MTKRSNTTYSLQNLYDQRFAFEDLFPVGQRAIRFDPWYHSNLYNNETALPKFLDFLRADEYKNVEKVFSSIGLKDQFIDPYVPSKDTFLLRILRSIDLYITGNTTIVDALKTTKKDLEESRKIISGTKIFFSSSPWDIATMSMRGVRSCMSWNNVNSKSLAGSILDPYCAIIYLSDLKKVRGWNITYGNNMSVRAIVRYVEEKGKPRLFMDRLYSDGRIPENKLPIIRGLFSDFLENATGYRILGPKTININNTFIPCWSNLLLLPHDYRSYRDIPISYSGSRNET